MNTIISILLAALLSFSPDSAETFVCPPCPCEAHANAETLEHDGFCPYCGMNLIEKLASPHINKITMETGSGNFLIEGGAGYEENTITVFYHKPKSFNRNSPILMVMPGSGRNGWDYRDAWIEASEKHGVLILSPHYPEEKYDFGKYHMGGLMYDMNIYDSVKEEEYSNELLLDEGNLAYKVNANKQEWIFNDFDRLFEMVVNATGSSQEKYDMFGHSAGGQILHRFVLFHPESKAGRILASNSGFYTMPDPDTELPFGLKNTPIDREGIRTAFRNRLVLFIGEKDNEEETGGILLRSRTVDLQGTHRLARGKYFYQQSKMAAGRLDTDFNWTLEIVPGVGHDFDRMSEAAAEYLYEANE